MILASHGIIASQIQSFVGLLDLYPSAAAAYSVRKLRAAYTGNAIRVRRSSDNTEQNIGFDATGNLDCINFFLQWYKWICNNLVRPKWERLKCNTINSQYTTANC